jgi:hypothetical protein
MCPSEVYRSTRSRRDGDLDLVGIESNVPDDPLVRQVGHSHSSRVVGRSSTNGAISATRSLMSRSSRRTHRVRSTDEDLPGRVPVREPTDRAEEEAPTPLTGFQNR